MKRHRKRRFLALGLLVGSVVGAGLALLLAPVEGRETRHRIRSGVQTAVERTRSAGSEGAAEGDEQSLSSEA